MAKQNYLIKIFAPLLVVLIAISFFGVFLSPVEGQSTATVYLRADGTIEGTDKIQKNEDYYAFTDDIAGSIVVEKDNIIIDGSQFTLSANGGYGIRLYQRHNVTVRNLTLKNTYLAFALTSSDGNTFVENTIINSEKAFYFWFSWNNAVTGNTISQASYAFDFLISPNHGSQRNVVTKNIVLSSSIGINLMESNNTFSDNIINSSIVGVTVSGHQNLFRNNTIICKGICFEDSSFDNDIDKSNLVNGKSIIYWVGHRDETVPSDAGFVLLSSCTNIKVQNLNLSGVTLVSTVDSMITGNLIASGEFGIQMVASPHNTVTGNVVLDNKFGLSLTDSEDNTIVGNCFSNNSYFGVLLANSHDNLLRQNDISNNGFGGRIDFRGFPFDEYYGDIFGVNFLHSSNNRFIGNNVAGNNQWGMRLLGSQHDNLLYCNNFIDNAVYDSLQISMPGATQGEMPNPNEWDNGTRGNYWSDYLTRYTNASEIDETGVGDTPFVINPNNIDYYPLMNPVEISELPNGTGQLEPFSALVVGAVIFAVVAAVVGLGLRVYFKKRQRNKIP